MAVATLTRGNTSIELPLEAEGGTNLLSTSFGKPNTDVRDNGGTLNPRVQDQFSALENYELRGKLFDYQTAHDLADLIKTCSGTPLELQIPSDVYPDTVTVAAGAGQDAALEVTFPAGKRNDVDVSLSLTRVDPDSVQAATEQQATTPTASGSGPVQLRVGGTTIDLPTADLSLSRAVGRPNDTIRRQPRTADPRYLAKAKVAADTFTLSFETVENILATLNDITDNIIRDQLGRRSVTLDFNGVLGLGAVETVLVGSSPLRQVQTDGQDWVTVPTLEFRRVLDTTA